MNLVEAVAKSRKYSRELRCIHRHTIEEHPQCFAKGRIKWPDDRTFEKLTENPWYQYPEYSIAYFDIETDGLFVAIGHSPNTQIFKDRLPLDPKGYIIVKDETKTPISGVFVAGDVSDWHYQQAVTAAGIGCRAAIDAHDYLENLTNE